jgi:hypothetical protein
MLICGRPFCTGYDTHLRRDTSMNPVRCGECLESSARNSEPDDQND